MRRTRQSVSTSSAPKPTTPSSHPTPSDTRVLTSTELKRRDDLSKHPHVGWVKPHTVFCAPCAKEIALDKVSRYNPHYWEIHEKRKTHQMKILRRAEEVVAVESATTRGIKRKRDSEVKVDRVLRSRTLAAKPRQEEEVDVSGPDNKENQNPRKADVASVLPEVPLVLRFQRKDYAA